MDNTNLPKETEYSLVELEGDQLRRAYGEGRIPMKISLVPNTFYVLARSGIVKPIVNKRTQKLSAGRGGSGSAFVDLGASILIYLYTNYGRDEQAARAAALNLLRVIDKAIVKAEDTDVVRENFITMSNIITGKRENKIVSQDK